MKRSYAFRCSRSFSLLKRSRSTMQFRFKGCVGFLRFGIQGSTQTPNKSSSCCKPLVSPDDGPAGPDKTPICTPFHVGLYCTAGVVLSRFCVPLLRGLRNQRRNQAISDQTRPFRRQFRRRQKLLGPAICDLIIGSSRVVIALHCIYLYVILTCTLYGPSRTLKSED